MKVRCSWCDTFGPDKEPFDDPSQSDTICPSCLDKQMKELQKMKRLYKKNPGAAWHEQQAAVAAEAETRAAKKGNKDLAEFFHGKEVAHHESLHKAKSLNMNPGMPHNIEKSGFHRGEYVGYGGGVWRIFKWGKAGSATAWKAVRRDPHAEVTGGSLQDISTKLEGFKENPRESTSYKGYSIFTDMLGKQWFIAKGGTVIGSAKSLAAAKKDIDLIVDVKENPVAVFGVGNPGKRKKVQKNPPGTVSARVMGVIYHHCMEIRAEKTGWKPGFYRHPFKRRSGVQILALDNGDLLIHSTKGVKLWEQAE